MARGSRRAAPLQTVPEDEAVEGPPAEVLALIEELESAVEEKVHAILAAATEAVFQLKNEFTMLMVKLPKKTRELPLSEFKAQFPDDFKTGELAQIEQKFAAMKEDIAAKAAAPATGRGTRTAAKRAAEPETVLRTTRRRVAPQAAPAAAAEAPPLTNRRSGRGRGAAEAAPPAAPAAAAAAPPAAKASFLGQPLQTPMPFAGEALPAAVTLLTQKRGGRTKGGAATDAAVIRTADGQQWAVGKQGLAAIPESHRQEVQDLLTAQFEFFASCLGKTVFARGRR